MNIENLATTGTYDIELSDISFQNLTFRRESNLMHLQHTLVNPVVITNLTISDIDFAGITIEEFEPGDLEGKTYVQIYNMEAHHVDGRERSLFNIYNSADVEVIDSTFNFIGNYNKGAVMFAGKEKAIATFRSSTFFNNTSVEGGVFSSEAESNIR